MGWRVSGPDLDDYTDRRIQQQRGKLPHKSGFCRRTLGKLLLGHIMTTKLLMLIAFAAILAQTAEAPKPPVIPPEHELEYVNAESQILQSQRLLEAAQERAKAAAADLTKDCGAEWSLSRDQRTGRFSCVSKAPASK